MTVSLDHIKRYCEVGGFDLDEFKRRQQELRGLRMGNDLTYASATIQNFMQVFGVPLTQFKADIIEEREILDLLLMDQETAMTAIAQMEEWRP